MNGPTRSFPVDRRAPARPEGSRPRPGDVADELDQFVDSEPVTWASPTRPAQGGMRDMPPIPDEVWAEDVPRAGQRAAAAAGKARDGPLADRERRRDAHGPEAPAAEEHSAGAAFSQTSASPRRDAFAKRLDEELSRPRERKSADQAPHAPHMPAAEDGPHAAPQGGSDDAAPSRGRAAPASEEERETARDGTGPRSEPRAWREEEPRSRRRADEPAASQEDPLGDEDARGPDDEPADALDWELDNAIGAIVANKRTRATPAARPAGEPGLDRQPDPAQGEPPAPPPARAVAPVGGKRARPIPTFRYERRDDPDEPFPAAAPDMDDPLASVFFQDAREAFEEAHDGEAPDGGQDPESVRLAEPEADEFLPDEAFGVRSEEDDELPPSLSRAARPAGGRRPAATRTAGIAAVVAGTAILGVLAVIGLSLFSGPRTPQNGEPPLIEANARDVKERPEDTGTTAEPDIRERAALGEEDELILPDAVTIEGEDATAQARPGDESAPPARRVRTVIVRPDGTIVPASPSADEAGQADAAPDAMPGAGQPAASQRTAQQQPDSEAARSDGGDGGAGESGESFDVAAADRPVRSDAMGYAGPPGGEGADGDPAAQVVDGSADPAAPAEDVVTAVPRPKPDGPAAAIASGSSDTRRSEPVDLGTDVASAGEQATRSAARTPTATSSGAAPWGVQLASQRSEADARQSFASLQRRYPSILGDVEPMIMRADLGSRGVFWRVRVGAGSRGEAAALCQRLKAAGADCFIGRN